jgi:hypothetical protein
VAPQAPGAAWLEIEETPLRPPRSLHDGAEEEGPTMSSIAEIRQNIASAQQQLPQQQPPPPPPPPQPPQQQAATVESLASPLDEGGEERDDAALVSR